MDKPWVFEREQMVEFQIRARGVSDQLVLEAMRSVPRHLFIPSRLVSEAYSDYPLPIGHGQTISQPFIVAEMTELIHPKPGDKILEVGTGSGYQAAVLAAIGTEVISIERISEVAALAVENLKRAEIHGVRVTIGDGTTGYPEGAPYDGILVTAATPKVPNPLLEQLREGGRLVAPVGGRGIQELIVVTKACETFIIERFGAVRFVPLIGEYGWSSST